MLCKMRDDPRVVGLDVAALDMPMIIWIEPNGSYTLLENTGGGPFDWHISIEDDEEEQDKFANQGGAIIGPPGPPGPQGERGLTGVTGNGYSAYELAVNEGFVGTLEQWLESLVGEDGLDAGGVSYDARLHDEPIPSLAFPITYTPTYVDGLVTLESWVANALLVKSIEYTYTDGFVTEEVRKIFDDDGTTILAQATWVYTYTLGVFTSSVATRNV